MSIFWLERNFRIYGLPQEPQPFELDIAFRELLSRHLDGCNLRPQPGDVLLQDRG